MRVVLVVHRFPEPSETFIAAKFAGLVDRGLDVHVACVEEEPAAWDDLPALRQRPELRARVHAQRPAPPAHPAHPAHPALRSGHRPDARSGHRPGAGPGAPPTSSPSPGGRQLPRSLGALVRARPHPVRLARYAHHMVSDLRRESPAGLRLDGCIAALRPDVLHYEFGSLAAQRTALRDLLGCRLTVSFRGWDLNFWSLDQPDAYGPLWEAVDAVHCLGQDLLDRARQRGLPLDVPVSLIPPSIDTDFFRPPAAPVERPGERPAGPLRVVTVARLHWKKGHEHALAAVALLRRRGVDVRYRVVGAGAHHSAVQAAVAAHGLGDVVRLTGHATPGEVRDELARADVLVHPAVSEGFSNAVLEAQSMAVPVVCADADGLAENVDEGVTGFVVPRRRPEVLADRLARLAADPELRARMGRAGRERVRTRFELGRQVDRWAEFYTAVAAGQIPPPGR